jgi:hypothetical protein
MRIARFFSIAAWLMTSLAAAADVKTASSSALGTPIVGFIVQSGTPQLRPVIGAIGAAVLGEPIPLSGEITRLVLSPMQTFALAERTVDQPLALLPVGADGVGAQLTIAGAFSRSDRIEFSPAGSVAALYSAALQRIQILSNLPESPQVAQEFDLSSLSAPVTSLAIDDTSNLLVGTSDGDIGGVYRIFPDSATTPLFTLGVPSAITFVAGTGTALVADSQTNQVLLVSGISGSPSTTVLAGPDNGVHGPNQIEVLAENRYALVANGNPANGSSNSLLSIDLQAGGVTAFPISASASGIVPLINRAGLAVSSSAPEVFWLFGNTAGNPALSFVADVSQTAVGQ